ncbi:unnamed protein product, partial [Rotaria socialis]
YTPSCWKIILLLSVVRALLNEKFDGGWIGIGGSISWLRHSPVNQVNVGAKRFDHLYQSIGHRTFRLTMHEQLLKKCVYTPSCWKIILLLSVVRALLNEKFDGGWIGIGGSISWLRHSPDLTPLDFFVGLCKNKCIQNNS